MPISTVAIVLREPGGSPAALASQIGKWLRGKGCKVLVEQTVATAIGAEGVASRRELGERADLVVVLGGDGTLLSTAREVAPAKTLLLGVNLGRLGFLTEVDESEVLGLLDRVLAGDFETEERSMLEAAVIRDGQPIATHTALNDVVVDKGAIARMIRLDVSINGKLLSEFGVDGLIVATPTGSTGYSLAAGGPLLHPSLRAFAITPICPHMLSTRPVIIPDDSEVLIALTQPTRDVTLTLDGQVALSLTPTDAVRVRRSPALTHLVRAPGRTYYEVLRQKFHWNEDPD